MIIISKNVDSLPKVPRRERQGKGFWLEPSQLVGLSWPSQQCWAHRWREGEATVSSGLWASSGTGGSPAAGEAQSWVTGIDIYLWYGQVGKGRMALTGLAAERCAPMQHRRARGRSGKKKPKVKPTHGNPSLLFLQSISGGIANSKMECC